MSVRAEADSLLPGNSTVLRVTVTGPAEFDRTVHWTLSGSGTLSRASGPSVTYSASMTLAAEEKVVVTATSVAQPSLSASVTLTLSGAAVSIARLHADQTSLFAGDSTRLTALVLAYGDANHEARWSLQGSGELSAETGERITYRAPPHVASAEAVTVTLTPVARPDQAQSVMLYLRPSRVSELRLSAASDTLDTGGTVLLTAEVSGVEPVSHEVDWSALTAGGEVRPLAADPSQPRVRQALYTPPEVTEETSVVVRATSRGDSAYHAEQVLHVRPARMPDSGGLRIEEVGASWRPSQSSPYLPCWIEVRNTSSQSVPLAGHGLRTASIEMPFMYTPGGPRTFPLPERTLAPGARLLLMTGARPNSPFNTLAFVQDTVSSTGPFCATSGFVELVRMDTGASVDFVRFGDSTEAPSAGGSWSGTNAPPLEGPTWTSLARVDGGADHDDATDWARAHFATPGGPNDVPPDAEDADADGIPDTAEVPGGRFAGLDLHALGARVNQRDIFVEVDYLQSADKGVTPRRETFDKVVAVFARHGVQLHLDVGTAYSATFDPARYNLGQGNPVLPGASAIGLNATPEVPVSVYALRDSSQDVARRSFFHYTVFGTSDQPDRDSSVGYADAPGSHVLLAMSGLDLDDSTPERLTLLVNSQAALFMHELGHNLNLGHAGPFDSNARCENKPNHLSVMNPLYGSLGLGPTTGPHAGDRYYLFHHLKGYVSMMDLQDSPLTSTFVIDYSDGSGSPLDERAVDEAHGLGRPGASWVDFDGSGTVNTPAMDLDGCRGITADPLRDYDEWGALMLAFSRYLAPPPPPPGPKQKVQVRTSHPSFIQENPLAPGFLEWLRTAGRPPGP